MTGNRVREFTADELIALARTFDVPIGTLFLMTADNLSCRLRVPDQEKGLPSDQLVWTAVGAEAHDISRKAQEQALEIFKLAQIAVTTGEPPNVIRTQRILAKAEAELAAEKELARQARQAEVGERGRTAKSPFTQTPDEGSKEQ